MDGRSVEYKEVARRHMSNNTKSRMCVERV